MKLLGYLLVTFGLFDLVGSHFGIDVWGEWLGIELPEPLWYSTVFIEVGIGYLLIKIGSKD
jgi:hypothetical protein